MKCSFKSPEQNPDRRFRGSMSVCLFLSPVSVTYCWFLVTKLAKIATHAHTSTRTQMRETLSQWTGFPFVRTPLILNGFFFFSPLIDRRGPANSSQSGWVLIPSVMPEGDSKKKEEQISARGGGGGEGDWHRESTGRRGKAY